VWRAAFGVALIQALLAGLGFLVAGVPAAGLLTLVCLVFGVIQLGVVIVLIPVVIYIFVGAIGGFLNAGIIGLFTGAVVLALGYKLFLAWLAQDSTHLSEAGEPGFR
jgi:predicted PurR-regulated permease PerM